MYVCIHVTFFRVHSTHHTFCKFLPQGSELWSFLVCQGLAPNINECNWIILECSGWPWHAMAMGMIAYDGYDLGIAWDSWIALVKNGADVVWKYCAVLPASSFEETSQETARIPSSPVLQVGDPLRVFVMQLVSKFQWNLKYTWILDFKVSTTAENERLLGTCLFTVSRSWSWHLSLELKEESKTKCSFKTDLNSRLWQSPTNSGWGWRLCSRNACRRKTVQCISMPCRQNVSQRIIERKSLKNLCDTGTCTQHQVLVSFLALSPLKNTLRLGLAELMFLCSNANTSNAW